MAPTFDVYLEQGSRRVFAGALDWPGLCRSARDEDAALLALVESGPRYAAALGASAAGFVAPSAVSALGVVERLQGNATTDFGAPGVAPSIDGEPLDEAGLARQTALLEASWSAFDRTAAAAVGVELTKGPRGGGRELHAIVRHVVDADAAYLVKLGGTSRKPNTRTEISAMSAEVRTALLDLVVSRARGAAPPRTPRSGSLWGPRYAVRRSAWHALDHAWEIEDRSLPAVTPS